MEKVIREFRVIETDDGFRIEIKGDKDKLREFVQGFGGPGWGGWRGHRRRGGHGWGPFGFRWGPGMWMHGPHMHGPWDFEVEIEEEDDSEDADQV